MTEITPQLINEYLNGRKSETYNLAKSQSDVILLHAEGDGFAKLLGDYRPEESPAARNMRLKNARLITKSAFSRIFNTLAKIGGSKELKINHEKQYDNIAAEDALGNYAEYNLPYFDSVRNWFFTHGLYALLTEPNGCVAVLPQNFVWFENEFPKPFPCLFRAEQVIYFEDNHLAIILLDEKAYLPNDIANRPTGNVYLIFTNGAITRAEQRSLQGAYEFIQLYDYTPKEYATFFPITKLGGDILSLSYANLYQSFIAGVLPFFDEALVLFSDMQMAIRQHAHPQQWVYGLNPCQKCHGTGVSKQAGLNNNGDTSCPSCGGKGHLYDPHSILTVQPPRGGDPAAPIPPAGYVQRDIAPVEFMQKHIDSLIKDGYDAVNMGFLDNTPLNESGLAKQTDRQELNAFIQKVANHSVRNILLPIYWYIAQWRYNLLLNVKEIEDYMPQINLPQTFDYVLTESQLVGEIDLANRAGMDSSVKTALTGELIRRRYETDTNKQEYLRAVIELNPLSGKTEDEKMAMFANGVITKVSYVVSSNIEALVRRAVSEKQDFFSLDYPNKLAILEGYAKEIINGNKVTQNIIPSPKTDPKVTMKMEMVSEDDNNGDNGNGEAA